MRKFNSALKLLDHLHAHPSIRARIKGAHGEIAGRDRVMVTIKFDHVLNESEISGYQRMGFDFYRIDGETARTGTIYPASAEWSALERAASRDEVLLIESSWSPAIFPTLDVSANEIEADVVWHHEDPSANKLTGKGIRIADFDTGIDVFHPSFFRADGDTLDWIDVDGNGLFNAGVDAVDLNSNGIADAGELLSYIDGLIIDPYSVWSDEWFGNNGNGFQTYWDWLYNDVNCNGERDYGRSIGFTEDDPTFGEALFITLDDNSNGRLDPGERIALLGSSKIAAAAMINPLNGEIIETARDSNLIETFPDYSGHGSSVSGIVLGNTPGRHIFTGIAPDAELLMANVFGEFNVPVLFNWALSKHADIMFYEFGNFVWQFLDGSSLLEEMITIENASTMQIIAAGNLTGGGKHVMTVLPPAASVILPIDIPEGYYCPATGAHYYVEEAWNTTLWRGDPGDLTIRLETPLHGTITLAGTDTTLDGYYLWSDACTSPRGTCALNLYIDSNEYDSLEGIWKLTVINNSGDYIEMMSNVADAISSWSGGSVFTAYTSNDMTVTWPATADSGLVVGSYSTRGLGGIEAGDISSFSGRGTRIDGAHLLDICAPGNVDIFTTFGCWSPEECDLGMYRAFSGTSAAIPHVAAGAALVMQADPSASTDQIVYRLISCAEKDAFTGPLYNDTWGHGKLRLLEATTGIDFGITLLFPNGGEELMGGDEIEIAWRLDGDVIPSSISIFVSYNGICYSDTIIAGLPPEGPYTWVVPNMTSMAARIRVIAHKNGLPWGIDASDTPFSIQGAACRYVSPYGSNQFPYCLPEWAAHDLSEAMEAASPGDTIMVATMTIADRVFVDKPVYLMGGWNEIFTEYNPIDHATIIESTESAVTFMNANSAAVGIEGFSISGRWGTEISTPFIGSYGAGVFSYRSDPVIKNNRFNGCGYAGATGFSGGGAIYCYDGDVLIEGNTIEGCRAQSGGGIFLYEANAVVRGNTISGCTPNPDYAGTKAGGAVYALRSTLSLEENKIRNNDGYKHGGGVYAKFTPLTSHADTLRDNDCLDFGGGIYCERGALSISRSVIVDNRATKGSGGIHHKSGELTMRNSLVASNETSAIAGGLCADSCWGDVANNTIDRNIAGIFAGNVYVTNAAQLMLSNNLITFGSGYGALLPQSGDMLFSYNDCYGNEPSDYFMFVPDNTNICSDPRYSNASMLDYHLCTFSGGIDAGDPDGPRDPDGSRADLGMFGGPGAEMAAPEYVKNAVAQAVDDTTIGIRWNDLPEGTVSLYIIFADTVSGFVPGQSTMIGYFVPGDFTNFYLHGPVTSCRYYHVCAVNEFGYAGGYSVEAGACIGTVTGNETDASRYSNRLFQNYPNPFNPTTRIVFTLEKRSRVSITIFDAAGRVVKELENGVRQMGRHEIFWKGRDRNNRQVAGGVYFCRLVAGSHIETKKLVLLR